MYVCVAFLFCSITSWSVKSKNFAHSSTLSSTTSHFHLKQQQCQRATINNHSITETLTHFRRHRRHTYRLRRHLGTKPLNSTSTNTNSTMAIIAQTIVKQRQRNSSSREMYRLRPPSENLLFTRPFHPTIEVCFV
jgi:hypothetical protein